MATKNAVEILIRAKDEASKVLDQAAREIEGLERQANRTGPAVDARFKQMEDRARSLGASLVGFGTAWSLAITAPLTALGAVGVRSTMQLETFQKSLDVLVGDAVQAKQVFDDLYEFDTETTFAWPSLTKATRLLAAFQFQAEDIIPTLKSLGDIAAGVEMNIDELAEIYGKARVQGRLFMEDVNQLTGRGIPVIQEFAKQFGVTEDAVRELVSSGQVNFSHLEAAIVSLTSEGGKFHNLMQAQGDTTEGRFRQLRKEFEQVTDLIGSILIPTIDSLISRARSAVEWFVELDEGQQQLIVTVGLAAAAVGPLAIGIGAIATSIANVMKVLPLMRVAFLAMTGPAGWITLAVTAITGLALYIASRRKDSLTSAVEEANDALAGGDADSLVAALGKLVDQTDGPVKTSLQTLQEELRTTGTVAGEVAEQVTQAIRDIVFADENAQRMVLVAQLRSLREAREELLANPTLQNVGNLPALQVELRQVQFDLQGGMYKLSPEEIQTLVEREAALEAEIGMLKAAADGTRSTTIAIAEYDTQIARLDQRLRSLPVYVEGDGQIFNPNASPDALTGPPPGNTPPPAGTGGAGRTTRRAPDGVAGIADDFGLSAYQKARQQVLLDLIGDLDARAAAAAEVAARNAAQNRGIAGIADDVSLTAYQKARQQVLLGLIGDLDARAAEEAELAARNAAQDRGIVGIPDDLSLTAYQKARQQVLLNLINDLDARAAAEAENAARNALFAAALDRYGSGSTGLAGTSAASRTPTSPPMIQQLEEVARATVTAMVTAFKAGEVAIGDVEEAVQAWVTVMPQSTAAINELTENVLALDRAARFAARRTDPQQAFDEFPYTPGWNANLPQNIWRSRPGLESGSEWFGDLPITRGGLVAASKAVIQAEIDTRKKLIEELEEEQQKRRDSTNEWLTLSKDNTDLINARNAVLSLLADAIPGVHQVIDAYVETGDVTTTLVTVFQQLLGRSESFLAFVDQLNESIGLIADIVGKVLSPVFNLLATVVGGVVDTLVTVWNFLFGWIPGMRVDGEAAAESPEHSSEAPGMREVGFGGVSPAVQFAVGTPLLEAAQLQLSSAQLLDATFSRADAMYSRVERFYDRLMSEGFRSYAAPSPAAARVGGSAFSRAAIVRG